MPLALASTAGHPDHNSEHSSKNNVTTLPPLLRLPESTAFLYPNLILLNFAMIFSLSTTSVFFLFGKCLRLPSFDFGYLLI